MLATTLDLALLEATLRAVLEVLQTRPLTTQDAARVTAMRSRQVSRAARDDSGWQASSDLLAAATLLTLYDDYVCLFDEGTVKTHPTSDYPCHRPGCETCAWLDAHRPHIAQLDEAERDGPPPDDDE